jgi:hypothetical protein
MVLLPVRVALSSVSIVLSSVSIVLSSVSIVLSSVRVVLLVVSIVFPSVRVVLVMNITTKSPRPFLIPPIRHNVQYLLRLRRVSCKRLCEGLA